MIATDPLSLVFLGCLVFSGAFLIISTVSGLGHVHLGDLGHAGHVGDLGGHLGGHVGHLAGHAGNLAHQGHIAANGHASAHAGDASGHAAAESSANPLASVGQFLAGSLNLFSILTFLFFFGLLGYLLHNVAHLFAFFSVALAALVGIAAGLGVSVLLARLFAAQSGVVTFEDSRLEGRLGKVSQAIRPGGVGEVIFLRAGAGRQSIGARSLDGEALDVDAEVVILSVHDGIADVQGWAAFMRQARAGAAPALQSLEALEPNS
jgi:hypothetical protein